jgi:hypothetical protein
MCSEPAYNVRVSLAWALGDGRSIELTRAKRQRPADRPDSHVDRSDLELTGAGAWAVPRDLATGQPDRGYASWLIVNLPDALATEPGITHSARRGAIAAFNLKAAEEAGPSAVGRVVADRPNSEPSR